MLFIKGLILTLLALGGEKQSVKNNTGQINVTRTSVRYVNIATDKAVYTPGDKITFKLDRALPATVKVKYKLLGRTIQSVPLKGTKWVWIAPAKDFTGYMVELCGTINGREKIYGTIAVDVSSDPSRFPRNGFLSAYGQLNKGYMDSVMSSLNRYHINYVQFQDWEYEHHKPLAGTPAKPDTTWKDIGSRNNYMSIIQRYISLAHSYKMLALHYNLIYGALDNAATEGVSNEWRLYEDRQHNNIERIPLPKPPFKSGLCIMNPANVGWQQFIAHNTAEAWAIYDFDGYQIDQMGDLNKPLYDFAGDKVDLPTTFGPFIKTMKSCFPKKRMVMNAVSQYGQKGISKTPVDFLYSEVWPPEDGYNDLANIIQHNDSLTKGVKHTVMAAYMDYDLAENQGYFSTPGVVLTDAVIFAFGGSHLELGEHMLGKEYFPNGNLKMKNDLKTAMVNYYDFLTAYENLLRDGGTFYSPVIASANNDLKLNNWPPQQGQVSAIGKDMGTRQVIHLINFNNANSLKWRDNKGTQALPATIENPRFYLTANKTIKKIWMASPDVNSGASTTITYTRLGNVVSFTLPSLQYWDMVVIEYQ